VKKKTVKVSGNTDQVWTFNNAATTTTVTAPDGGQTTYTFTCKSYYGCSAPNYYLENRIVQVNSSNLKFIAREWDENKVYGMRNFNVLPNNVYVKKETVTTGPLYLYAKTRIVEYAYDANGRLRERLERDWNGPSGTPGAVLRKTEADYHLAVPYASSIASSVTNDANAYWKHTTRLTDVKRDSVSSGSGQKYAVTEYVYDLNGNVTTEKRWDSEKSPSVPALGGLNTTNAQVINIGYDANGNLTDTYEPDVRTRVTNDGGGRMQSRVVGYDSVSSMRRTTNYTWQNGMAVKRVTDVDNDISERYTYDSIGRNVSAVLKT
jgi:hypothetical protein